MIIKIMIIKIMIIKVPERLLAKNSLPKLLVVSPN